jgi:hypothetical protein
MLFQTIHTLISLVEAGSLSTSMRKLSLSGLLLFGDNDEKGSMIVKSEDKSIGGLSRSRLNTSPTRFISLWKKAFPQNGISIKRKKFHLILLHYEGTLVGDKKLLR